MAPGLTPVAWMVGVSLLSALAASAMVTSDRAVWLGMLAPLAVASISWIAMERAYRRTPARLNGVIMRAFAGKLVFFAVYVTVAIRVLAVEPVPFVLSLAGYFIVLHVIEALWMKRLFVP